MRKRPLCKVLAKLTPGGKIFLDDDSCVRMMAFWKVCEERFYDLGDLLQSSFTSVCSGHKREKAIGDTFKINCPFIRKTFSFYLFEIMFRVSTVFSYDP